MSALINLIVKNASLRFSFYKLENLLSHTPKELDLFFPQLIVVLIFVEQIIQVEHLFLSDDTSRRKCGRWPADKRGAHFFFLVEQFASACDDYSPECGKRRINNKKKNT